MHWNRFLFSRCCCRSGTQRGNFRSSPWRRRFSEERSGRCLYMTSLSEALSMTLSSGSHWSGKTVTSALVRLLGGTHNRPFHIYVLMLQVWIPPLWEYLSTIFYENRLTLFPYYFAFLKSFFAKLTKSFRHAIFILHISRNHPGWQQVGHVIKDARGFHDGRHALRAKTRPQFFRGEVCLFAGKSVQRSCF